LLTRGEGQLFALKATGYVLEGGVIRHSDSLGQHLNGLGLNCRH